jgi:sarcosine oxidase gamma subunit
VRPSIVTVHAEPSQLDALSLADAIVHRVAPDEAMVTGVAGGADVLVGTVTKAVEDDPGAVVLDDSDGWAAWAIAGPDARRAFSRVSPLELPAAGSIQGDVLRLPARVAASANEVVVFVPAAYGAWVERKLRERCPELTGAGA